ncbi:MAG: PDZ domain-containing protein [Planctomycetota bacterium]
MKLSSKLLAAALVFVSAPMAGAQDGLGPLQGRSEKLARETSAAVVGLGRTRIARTPTAADVNDSQAGGAGFVIDEEGRILTASSLVPASGRVEVIFKGHHRAMAKVIARDPRTRSALIQVEELDKINKLLGTKKLPTLKLGSSAELKRGRVVATVGNVYNSMQIDGQAAYSLGVVSSIGRLRDADGYKGVAIETDAAVNPGSYGGPLCDLDGKVVGIVIEPVSTKRWLGVAVPIDDVKPILEDLRAGRAPAPPRLGLSIATTAEPSLQGVKVAEVDADGPAAKAGIKAGDLLLSLDGARIVEAYDIEKELALLGQGSAVELALVRGGKKLSINVTLGAAKPEAATTPTSTPVTTESGAPDGKPYLGITVDEKDDGLFVKSVVEDGPAAKAKLAVGAKIVSIDGKAIAKKSEMIEAVAKKSPGDKLKIQIENAEGFHKTVTVTLGTKDAPKDTAETPKKSDKPGFMGVRSKTPEDEDTKGLEVELVLENSPAAKAGLKVGDIIVEFEGQKVDDPQAFTDLVRKYHAGDTVKLKVRRDGKSKDVSITLGERPGELDQQPNPHENPHEQPTAAKKSWVGFELEERGGKIVVTDIAAGSPAESAKIKKGYAIVGANDDEKITLDKLEQLIASKKIGEKLTLRLENEDGFSKTVTVTLGERPKDK